MARRYKYCIICRRTITDKETDRGLYVQTERGVICATCAQRLDETDPEQSIAAPAAEVSPRTDEPLPAAKSMPEKSEQLVEIGHQIEDIRRTLLFEKSSAWGLIGVLAQTLAVAMALVAAFRWLDNPDSLLLVAILFQVMALTFFVKARL